MAGKALQPTQLSFSEEDLDAMRMGMAQTSNPSAEPTAEMPTGDSTSADNMKAAQEKDAAAQAANRETGTSKVGQAGDVTMAAGTASANPYVMAAGVALKGAGMISDATRASEQSGIDNYNKRIMAERSAIRPMFA